MQRKRSATSACSPNTASTERWMRCPLGGRGITAKFLLQLEQRVTQLEKVAEPLTLPAPKLAGETP
jgi:hypothetical protein